ncbi:MAG: 30S ribosome-binding factor RbfA [Chitinophagales bacterium]|jgi:ribosome-binding factor A|nr:30S ribosome-binding factor RbfA [Chitinophagales bacterium]HNL06829.1 30S ribosome-binding factor RbfA [Chitinophagales bacterium]
MESIKQQQVASLIQEALSDVFLRHGRDYYGNRFVTIANVRMTPDLLVARIYLSLYNATDKETVIDEINMAAPSIRHALGNKIRHKMRRIPALEFFLDDTLDEMQKVEDLFKKIHDSDSPPLA